MALARQTYTNDGGKTTTSSTNPYIAQRQNNTSTGTANNNAQGKALTGYQAQRQYETSTGTAPRVNLPTAGASANKGASSFGNASAKWGNGSGVVNTDLLPYKLGTANNTQSEPTGGYYGYGGDGSSDGGSSDGGGGSYQGSSADDVINEIKALLKEQYDKAKASYATTLEQAKAQNKQAYNDNRDQANLNYMRAGRRLDSLYGNAPSGRGLSNRTALTNNWMNNLAQARQNYTNNDASAQATYDANLSNTANTLAQGWYNYILPFKVQDAQQARDYDFRKFLATL